MPLADARSDHAPVPERFVNRLAELAALEAGWLDGDGKAVTPAALDLAVHVIAHLAPTLGDPGIFPTVDGGVSIEWASPVHVRIVEVTPGLVLECMDLATRAHADVRTLRQAIAFFDDVTGGGTRTSGTGIDATSSGTGAA